MHNINKPYKYTFTEIKINRTLGCTFTEIRSDWMCFYLN